MIRKRADIRGIIERTLRITTLNGNATAFAVDIDDRQYLVTAKHVADKILVGETVRIQGEPGVAIVSPDGIALGDGNADEGGVDVAVLRLNNPIPFQSHPLPLGSPEDFFITQDVAIPTTEHFVQFENFRPPLVVTRTGTVAALVESRGMHTGDMLVEIQAYPGFSGSPVVYWDAKERPRVGAVAARWSYRAPLSELGPNSIHSGFIGCFHIHHVSDLIGGME